MLLAADIGNTNVVVGIFDDGDLLATWRFETEHQKMADEWWALLATLAPREGIDLGRIDGVILASGVPVLTATFTEMARRRVGCEPIVVSAALDLGIGVLIDNPAEAGADRLANAVAARARYGGPAIVVDSGTATNFDVVSAEGDYIGGAIAPGVTIALRALTSRAARLTAVDLALPPRAIGRNTTHSVQSGTVFGYIALIEGLLQRITAELGQQPIVIGTGGLGRLFADHIPAIQVYEPNLTLIGLRLIYERVR